MAAKRTRKQVETVEITERMARELVHDAVICAAAVRVHVWTKGPAGERMQRAAKRIMNRYVHAPARKAGSR